MKKIKVFLLVSVLLLTTVGIWAGKNKFTTGTIYAYSGIKFCQLTGSTNLVNLTTISVGCIQATISDCSGNIWSLYLWNGSAYLPLYFPGC